MGYDFDIIHKPRVLNRPADALSRHATPFLQCPIHSIKTGVSIIGSPPQQLQIASKAGCPPISSA